MKISLCITTFNRFEMCMESFAEVVNDDRIDDIVIMDDDGAWDNHQCLKARIDMLMHGRSKVKLRKQLQNRGMSVNKKDAIAFAKNNWAIILDDDNKIRSGYLDALYAVENVFEEESEIYCPARALPNFIYDSFAEESINRNSISDHEDNPLFGALLNTCNYVVNKNFYLKTWQHNPDMKGSDTIWHAYNHLKNFGSFYVVPGMEYDHRVHDGSGFLQDIEYNMAKAAEIEALIKAL